MNITSVKVKKVDFDKVKGMATITIGDCLVLTGLKVIEGMNGLFVTMPSKKGKEGELDSKTVDRSTMIYFTHVQQKQERRLLMQC